MSGYLTGADYIAACRRYREQVVNKYKKTVSDIKGNGRPLRVGHHVSWPHQYFPSLARAFLAESDCIDYEVLHNFQQLEEVDALREQGVSVISASDIRAINSRSYDLLFFQHPYFQISDICVDFFGIMRAHPEHLLSGDIAKHPLLCFVPYAFTVIDDRHHKVVDGFHDLPIHNVAWRVYCESEWHLNRAKAKAALGADNWVMTGYPKLDEIVCLTKRRRSGAGLRIIWAPHHNRSFQGIPIPEMHDYFKKLVSEIPDLTLVFRPHPNLVKGSAVDFDGMGMTPEQFSEILSYWERHDRGEFNFSSNLADLFNDSDLMVTDCGGFQAEYMYSGKPLISYIQRSLLNSFALDSIERYAYSASSVERVDYLVRRIIVERCDDNLDARLVACGNIVPQGGAGVAIVNDIKRAFFS